MGFLAGAVAVTMAAVTLVLRLWESDLRVPYVYHFDGLFHARLVKSVVEGGWFLNTPSLGAPDGLRLHDFPMGGENLQFLMIKLIGLLGGDWATVMNLYFLTGFALVSACAHVVFRQIGASRWMALALAVLFSLLPYHFVLGESQLFQATYFAVPLGAFLVLDAAGWDVWRAPFLARASTGRHRALPVRWVVRIGLVAVVGSAGSYYAPFTAVLVVAGGLLGRLTGDRRAVGRAMAVMVGLGLVLAANNAPTLLYQREHGRNTEVANRAPGESDFYALRIVDLFLPIPAHRLEPMAALKARLDRFWPASPVWPAPHTPLGAAGAAGLALSLSAAAAAAAGRSRFRHPQGDRLAQLGVLNAAAILVAVSTGFASLLALAGVTELRVWSRMSVFIAFFALSTLGLAAEPVGARLRALPAARRLGPRRGRVALVAVGAVALGAAVLDQTTAFVPAYAVTAVVFDDDRSFVQEIERRMPAGSAVFQLPLSRFPEGGAVHAMMDYGLLRGPMHSRHLRWSYGAMKGRPSDWTWSLGGRSAEAVVDSATAVGFTGLYIDRAGFVDGGRALEGELQRLVGPSALVSRHGLAFWDLRRRADDQRRRLGPDGVSRLARLVLSPVAHHWGQGFAPSLLASRTDVRPATPTGQPMPPERPAWLPALLELVNPLPEARRVSVRLPVRAPDGATATARLAWAAGTATADLGAGAGAFEFDLVLSPGRTILRLTSAVPVLLAGPIVVSDADAGRPPP